MASLCSICGEDTGKRGGAFRAKDGVVCEVCYKASGIIRMFGNLSDVSISELRQGVDNKKAEIAKREAHELEKSEFVESRKIGNNLCALHIDDENKKCYFSATVSKGYNLENADGDFFNFDAIESCEIAEDGETLSSVKKAGVGRAILGGVLFGSTGAIVGAATGGSQINQHTIVTSMVLRVQLKDGHGSVQCNLLSAPTDPRVGVGATLYASALEAGKNMVSAIEGIIDASAGNADNTAPSAPDELRKYKSLLDDGIITQEEFDAKKKQLLGL